MLRPERDEMFATLYLVLRYGSRREYISYTVCARQVRRQRAQCHACNVLGIGIAEQCDRRRGLRRCNR